MAQGISAALRSLRQLRRFVRPINADKVFGTHDRQVGGLGALEGIGGIDADLAKSVREVGAVAHQRLAAECRDLATDVPEPDLRAHFLRMASTWTELTDQTRFLH
jgi:hypothetical protein